MENEFAEIVASLREKGKNHLADIIQKEWKTPILDYARAIFSYSPAREIEPELLLAFEMEFDRLDVPSDLKDKAVDFIKAKRVVQTAPHTGLVQNARMFSIDWLCTQGMNDTDVYLVGTYSGIPFSNSWNWPGCITYGNKFSIEDIISPESVLYSTLTKSEIHRLADTNDANDKRISLIPATMQDTLVYRSEIPDKLINALPALNPKLKEFFPEPTDTSFTKYALKSAESIEKKILRNENIIFFDIGEVAVNYLLKVLDNDDHIITKILLEPEYQKKIKNAFGDEIMFYAPYYRGKYEKQESLFFNDEFFFKGKEGIVPMNKDAIKKQLQEEKLCPATLLVFLIFSFINHAKCLGSFAQSQYLPDFKDKWIKTDLLKDYDIEDVPVANLTTGMFDKNKTAIYPIDIILGEKFNPDVETFGELLLPAKEIILK